MPRRLYGSSSSFSSGPRRVLCWWSWQCLWRVALLLPFLFFFWFFAVEMLFLFLSNKRTKVKLKIKDKKTNSASENAIRSSYFVIELCKLSSSLVESKNSNLQGLITGYLHIPYKQWAWDINSDQSQRPKKIVSDIPGLVNFAIGLVNSVFNLPDGKVMCFEEFEEED